MAGAFPKLIFAPRIHHMIISKQAKQKDGHYVAQVQRKYRNQQMMANSTI